MISYVNFLNFNKVIKIMLILQCGMVFNIDDKNDIDQHESFHNRFTDKKCYRVTVTQLKSWKKYRCEYLIDYKIKIKNFSLVVCTMK